MDTQQDYDCPICQEVLKMPIRTRQCQHLFCKDCFQTAVRSQGLQCPMCRGPVSEREPKALDIQQTMRETKAKCRACGNEKFLNRMRLHYKTCRSYIEEYGPVSNPTPVVPAQVPIQTHSSEVIPDIQIPTVPESIQRLYTCPYCTVSGLGDLELVEHCVQYHSQERTPAVCPICMCMPFGDPNYYSRNLIGHFLRRHPYSYSGYMDEDDEDVQICMAVQMSVERF
ncbi:E3 ubiquitin-protein ligase RNF138-like [Trichomycterus rosablanca]|uniref:E3 ubiquitin-protein ligase RNF138-like n=1 Tax=Trichomycterus rosablanca TaxID=2290929 RepID=UPI002F34F941